MAYRYRGGSNLGLVEALEEDHLFRSLRLRSALLKIPRGHFLPPEVADDAYVDHPIHITQFGFNVSAPHMHAICLEALDIQPGQAFLDVGSGCGHVTALGGYLVGPAGTSVGVDINANGIAFAKSCVQDLSHRGVSLPQVVFEHRNVFVRDLQDRKWDRIHCGASCPHKFKHTLYEMLKPGGIIVTPIGNNLIRATKDAFGYTKEEKLMGVRYSDLIIPSKRELVENEKLMSMQVQLPTPAAPNTDFSNLFDSDFLSDVIFVVGSHRIPAHKAILASRCEYFAALYRSGMAGSDQKEDFTHQAFKEVLRYIYSDSCDIGTIELAAEIIRAADFYRLERLKMMCSFSLGRGLSVENSCDVLVVAFQYNALELKSVTHDFIVKNYDGVRRTKGYNNLPGECLREILDVVMRHHSQA